MQRKAESQSHRLQELGDFLRTRRERLLPGQVELPAGGRRRTPGLRRAEVAQLAGVSVDWYTWLEQGRPITVSREVLESLVQALHLSSNEREHLFFLAHQQPPPEREAPHETVSVTVQHFLDHLGTSPAYVTGRRWDILAWNEAANAVFGDFGQITTRERNVVWRMFLSPAYREVLDDWEGHARHVLAQFRATYDRFLGDPWMKELLDELMMGSPEFRAWWPEHEVLHIQEGLKLLKHPRLGCLVFEHLTFQLYDAPDLKVTVYTPLAESDTLVKLNQLLSEHASINGGRRRSV